MWRYRGTLNRAMSVRPVGPVANDAKTIQLAALSPPLAFAHVCPYIFRCADPSSQPDSFLFLDSLNLKSIILLSIEYPSKLLESFCTKHQIELHHFGIERRWPAPNPIAQVSAPTTNSLFLSPHEINSFSVFESIVKDALELLLDIRNHPVLVTDTCVYKANAVLVSLKQGFYLAV